MIKIESFLRSNDGTFVSIADATGVPGSSRHVEGAIELSIDNVPVLDKTLWDDVDQLWAYIGDMLTNLRRRTDASTYFPDQPIKLEFRRLPGGRVLITLENGLDQRAASVDEQEFIEALSRHANLFFRKMSSLIPANRIVYEDVLRRFNLD